MKLVCLGSLEICGQMMLRSYVQIVCCHEFVRPVGKADLTEYREASVEVTEVRSHFAATERASLDKAYGDLTSAVRERLQKLQGQPVSAGLLPSTYTEGSPQGPTAAEGTVQKGTSITSYCFCFLPLQPALFGHSDPSWID